MGLFSRKEKEVEVKEYRVTGVTRTNENGREIQIMLKEMATNVPKAMQYGGFTDKQFGKENIPPMSIGSGYLFPAKVVEKDGKTKVYIDGIHVGYLDENITGKGTAEIIGGPTKETALTAEGKPELVKSETDYGVIVNI